MITITADELTESEKAVLIPLRQSVVMSAINHRKAAPIRKPEGKHLMFGKSWNCLTDREKVDMRREHPEVYKLKFKENYGFEPQILTF